MDSPIRAVMIGCGSRAQVHAEAMTRSDEFDLVAVCDLERSRAEDTADRFDVPGTYKDLDDAIAEEAPVHVSAVTPPGIRPGIVEAVLAHEPASLVTEKPIANDLVGVERIEAASAAADTVVTICHQKVFAEEVRAVRAWIDDDRFGEVERFVGSSKLGLADQGSHFLHTLGWLLDERPDRVRGFAEGRERLLGQGPKGHAEPEDASIEVAFPGGARAFLHHGPDAPDVPGRPQHLKYRLDVVGSNGHAQFRLGDGAFVRFDDGTVERIDDVPDFDEDAYMTTALYDAQAEVLRGDRDEHPSRLVAAAAAHRTLDGALRSMMEGRTVDPVEGMPLLGRSTNERAERFLAARQPLCVDSSFLADGDRSAALDAVADAGVAAVDLAATGADHLGTGDPEAIREALSERGLSAPVVTVGDRVPDADLVERAAAVGAEAIVVDAPAPDATAAVLDGALDAAADHEVTLALANRVGGAETAADLRAVLDVLDHAAAGACLSPLHLVAAGESVSRAVTSLGEDLTVLRVQDAVPGADLCAQRANPDSQVPCDGGAAPTPRLLELVVEHAPMATWTFTLEGTDSWEQSRRLDALGRALRHVESSRPA